MKFNIGHFPVGTICEVDVKLVTKGPIQVEVAGVSANGPHSWVIQTDSPSCIKGITAAYHISHVTRIIKRGTGRVGEDPKSMDTFKRTNWFEYQNSTGLFGITKHPSQYTSLNTRDLIFLIASEYVDPMHILDNSKLMDMLHQHNVIRFQTTPDCDYMHYTRVSKKKLRSAIKRMVNKCLVNRTDAQKEQDKIYYDSYKRELEERDLEADWMDDVDLIP